MTNPSRPMTIEEREHLKETCEKLINLFICKEIDSINLKEVSGKFLHLLFIDNVDPFIRKLDKGMKLDYIINGYSSSGRKPINQNPNVREGFYVFGIKFTCPKCEKWMQLIQHDVILSWDGELIEITVKPDPICPHCKWEFKFVNSDITIGEYRGKEEIKKEIKEEIRNKKEIKKSDGSYPWP